MINKFETVGIGVSIIAMVLALFLIRVDSTVFVKEGAVTKDQEAAVVLSGEENSRNELIGAINTASNADGTLERMIIDDVIIGSGEEVAEGDTISVHYIGTLQNGQQFDNSYVKGTPFSFTVGEGRVIPGWEQGVIGMQHGGQRILVIPPHLAYGEDGFGPIPAGATLVFAIELLEIQ